MRTDREAPARRDATGRILLAIETATARQTVAVVRDGDVLALVEQDADGSHARLLMPTIDRVLREARLTLRDLHGLALSIGPGSFTGLRVGLATLLGFRAVLGTPIIPVPTLEAMAWNLRGATGLLVPVLKSRQQEVYWAAYEWMSDGTVRTHTVEQVGPPSSVARAVQAGLPVTLFGDGVQAFETEITAAIQAAGGAIVTIEKHHPSAVGVALAAQPRLAGGEIAGPIVTPRYVQRTEAEVQFEQRQGLSVVERRRRRLAVKLTRGPRSAAKKARGQ